MEGKYGKLLTALLIVVVIIVVGLLIFLGYDVISGSKSKRDIAEALDNYDNLINSEHTNNTTDNENNTEIPVLNEEIPDSSNDSDNSSSNKVTYKGYNVVGKIEIPVINIKYFIFEKATATSIEQGVAVSYGPGPNQIGNTVIVGHNYRNGAFFGSNKKLKLGDKVYITDNSGTRLKYNIYNIYETSPDDGDYMVRDTAGKREISLSTCTDNSKARLVIWAAEEQ